ncbi:hypothetical protein [Spirosoma sp.]|uniref:hypothetical protein n=1 Tax=Spirosoma sp. TaxID=1899569 RepID=UPI00262AEE5A|nr:hypothetical protein [Spirosoma sp.]MCX6216556.1 hypothetical protein [Spirosoma sp.]
MKIKGVYSIIAGFALLLIGSLVAVSTGNVLAGLVSIPAVSLGVTYATGVQLFDLNQVAFTTLASIPRTKQQTINPGGGRKLFLMATDNFAEEWPKKADIVDGEITAAPSFVTGGTAPVFVEVQVSDNSLKQDGALKGASGYQSWEQSLEVKIAGFTKEQCDAIEKLINTEVVAVCILNDGVRTVSGTSLLGLQFEITHTTGAKGSDRREWTLKAKQDGFMHNYMPIADTVTIPGVAAA